MRHLLHLVPAVAALACFAPVSHAAPPDNPLQTPRDLVRADGATLDALYAAGTVGDIPTGFLPGRVIVEPGTRRGVAKSRRLHWFWQGKVSHGDGTAHNRVFGITAVPMTVYHGQSWHDGGPVIVVDYADSWRMFRGVRDELREVAPGLYLGRTYVTKKSGTKQATVFALSAPAE